MTGSNGQAINGTAPRFQPIWELTPRPFWVRLVNAVGGRLRRVWRRWPGTDPDALMAAARRRTGLSDFGDPSFREGLGELVNAFEASDTASPFGRVLFRENCIELLSNRLKIRRDLTRHPEILNVPVRRPLFIAGLPRSGTTLLHRLMSEDPDARTLLFWESLWPSPPPTTATYRTDPRIDRARRRVAFIDRLSPGIATAHELGAVMPEEDNNLFSHGFFSAYLGFLYDVPDYIRWLELQDLRASYHDLKTQLQLLSWRCPGGHWVTKSPIHLYGLDALLDAFPDACIIQTHRDPLQVVPSVCSLQAATRLLTADRVDLHRIGDELSEALGVATTRATAARRTLDPSRFYDVAYRDLVADPVGTARDASRHFGYDFTPEFETRARRWLSDNPQHKRGVHRYSLAEFGQDIDSVNRYFTGYREWLAEHVPQAV